MKSTVMSFPPGLPPLVLVARSAFVLAIGGE
jgi:hypothetical protein